ncbi:MAG: dethiobiotin synthase [Deltaproteobacteria bacterium]|nr:dethiobiotin synthase [Deltaproteobacteria bacterium]
MGEGFFVTGTDTGVGKSVVAGTLLRRLARRGRTLGVKAVQTGCGGCGGEGAVPDLALWEKAVADCRPRPELFCPCRLEAPCSPHLAARLQGIEIDLESLVRQIGERRGGRDWTVVEGAGGLLVPIQGPKTMLDLARMLKLPILLVADNRLGAINHTLLSLAAIRGAGLELAGVVLNNTTAAIGDLEKTIRAENAEAIRGLGPVDILAEIPFLPDFSPGRNGDWRCREEALGGVA